MWRPKMSQMVPQNLVLVSDHRVVREAGKGAAEEGRKEEEGRLGGRLTGMKAAKVRLKEETIQFCSSSSSGNRVLVVGPEMACVRLLAELDCYRRESRCYSVFPTPVLDMSFFLFGRSP